MVPEFKVSPQALSLLFSECANSKTKVIWLRSPDYNRQIYLGPNFEKIWQISSEVIYKTPSLWNNTLVKPRREQIIHQLKSRGSENSLIDNTMYYKISDSNQNIQWIKDTCFHLFDHTGVEVAVAGIAEVISERQWEKETKQRNIYLKSKREKAFQEDILFILNKELKLTPATLSSSKSEPNLPFTPREIEFLPYLARGKPAKVIARELGISPRTVEFHADNIKKKLDCHTITELIAKLNSMKSLKVY